jgi:hypothetical protein
MTSGYIPRYASYCATGGPPFNPLSIAGCTLWLDGNDPLATGVQPENDSSLDVWYDKSPSLTNFTSLATPPIFYADSYKALGSIYTSGDGCYMGTDGFIANINSTAMTLLCMCQINSGIGEIIGTPFSSRDGSSGPSYGYNFYAVNNPAGPDWEGWAGPGTPGFNQVLMAPLVEAVNFLCAARIGSGSVEFFGNGTSYGSLVISPMTDKPSYISSVEGDAFQFPGFIREIVSYDSTLSDGDLALITGYLTSRWQS